MSRVSHPSNSPRGWVATASLLAGVLILYVATALVATEVSGSSVIGAAVSNAAVFAAGLYWLRATRRRGGSELPAHQRGVIHQDRRFWGLVALTLVFCWLVGQTAAVWLYGLVGSPGFDQHTAAKSGAPVVAMLLLALVLAPMGEEMFMRGIAYSRLRRHVSPVAAALVSSGVFSLLHLNLVQIVLTLPLGMLLAAVYERTGRLSAVVLLHVVFNLLSVIVPVGLVTGVASFTFIWLGGAGLVVLLAGLYLPVIGTGKDARDTVSGVTGTPVRAGR